MKLSPVLRNAWPVYWTMTCLLALLWAWTGASLAVAAEAATSNAVTPASATPEPAHLLPQTEATALLQRERERLAEWEAELRRVREREDELAMQASRLQAQLLRLTRTQASMQMQIEVLQGSVLLSRVLQELQATLPVVRVEDGLPDRIARWRLQQFDLVPSRALPGGVRQQTDTLLASLPLEQRSPALRSDLEAILREQMNVLDALSEAFADLVQQAAELQGLQDQVQIVARAVSATVQEQLFWLPSQPPMDLEWLRTVPEGIQAQLAEMSWRTVWSEFVSGLRNQPLLFLPVLLLALGLLGWRKAIQVRLSLLSADVGQVHRDTQWHTPLAVLLNILLALPGTLLLALAGLALRLDGRGQNLALGDALLQMSLVWLVFYTAQRLLIRQGVAERHFGWDPAENAALRQRLIALGVVVLGMVGVVTFARYHAAGLVDDYLGNLIVLAGYAVMAWLMATLLTHTARRDKVSAVRLTGGVVLALLPLVLIVAVVLGYYYTAVRLTAPVVDTLYLLIIWRVLDGMVRRSLTVAGRRLAWRHRVQGTDQPRSVDLGDEGELVVEAAVPDVELLETQSARLARLGLLVGACIGLYGIWAEVFAAFTYLSQVVLYEYNAGTGEAVSLVPITLFDALAALVIAVITIILARNLPGLLEVIVLARLHLAQGSNYAIITLLSYVIVAAGFIATLSTLGVSWDKLQWLVAALSVGLGFGLQEIFANFVSGIIILFERPVRIGDTVTVGSLTGTVARIRTRATTIVDSDRKEIIVPNKTFVTGQLINWTLSDTVTRVTIPVGVAYGSDLGLVRHLLLQIARSNPRVMAEPPPSVWFLGFGNSNLDHELRLFVASLGDRAPVLDEVNRAIAREFAAHGIEITYNQVQMRPRPEAEPIKVAEGGAAERTESPSLKSSGGHHEESKS